jgi:hypothetical protein
MIRNGARGAAFWNVNLGLNWLFGFGKASEAARTESMRVVVRSGDPGAITAQRSLMEKKWRFNFYLQSTNVLNHFNPTHFVGVMTSPFFGRPTASAPARQVETGVRFSF